MYTDAPLTYGSNTGAHCLHDHVCTGMLLLQASDACMTFKTHLSGGQAQTFNAQCVMGGEKEESK